MRRTSARRAAPPGPAPRVVSSTGSPVASWTLHAAGALVDAEVGGSTVAGAATSAGGPMPTDATHADGAEATDSTAGDATAGDPTADDPTAVAVAAGAVDATGLPTTPQPGPPSSRTSIGSGCPRSRPFPRRPLPVRRRPRTPLTRWPRPAVRRRPAAVRRQRRGATRKRRCDRCLACPVSASCWRAAARPGRWTSCSAAATTARRRPHAALHSPDRRPQPAHRAPLRRQPGPASSA